MSTDEVKFTPEEEKEIMDIVTKRLKLQPEQMAYIRKLLAAKTASECLEAYEMQRQMILQGDPEAIERQHKLGRLTARERISKLVDAGSFREFDLRQRPYETGFDIGEERGNGDGVVVGCGQAGGRPLSVYAWDATTMGGTVAATGARKVCTIMDDTERAKVPIVGIFDSPGLRAHDVIQFPDFFGPSAMAYFQTLVSGVLPTIALVMGPCTAELALVAMLSDFVFMVRNTSYMHLAPPPPGITPQTLGAPWNVHAKVTGCCDVLCNDEEDCLKKCRQLLSFLPLNNTQKPPVVDTGDDPNRCEEELLNLVPVSESIPFSMYKLISLIVDNGEFFEIKRYFASNDIVGFARFDGRTVGIVASNPQYKAGCMNIDAANKQGRFTRFCDAFNIPVVWLVDNPGFLPAKEEETRGLIRTGCAIIMSNSEMTVPRMGMFIRKGYGGGSFGNVGRNLRGDLQVAWPTQSGGMMAPGGAVSVLYRHAMDAMKDPVAKERQRKIWMEELRWSQLRGKGEGAEEFIDPRETRPYIINTFKWLENKKEERPERKHENIRL